MMNGAGGLGYEAQRWKLVVTPAFAMTGNNR